MAKGAGAGAPVVWGPMPGRTGMPGRVTPGSPRAAVGVVMVATPGTPTAAWAGTLPGSRDATPTPTPGRTGTATRMAPTAVAGWD